MSQVLNSPMVYVTEFPASRRATHKAAGMTLLELIVACAILMVLATVALPIQRVTLVRNRESRFFLSFSRIPAPAYTLQLGRNHFGTMPTNLRDSK